MPSGASRDEPLLRVERVPGGLRVRCRVEHPQLRARRPATPLRAAHPGTAVRHGEALFEVIAIEPGEPPYPYRYRLEPLPAEHTIRSHLDLGPEALPGHEAELRAELERRRRSTRLERLLPLVGALPRRHLLRLEREAGIDPRRAVVASALAGIVLGGGALVYQVLLSVHSLFEPGVPPPLPPLHPLFGLAAALLLVESCIRFRYRDPLGSLPVVIAADILEHAGWLAPAPAPAPPAPVHLVDRVTRVPAVGGAGLELRVETPAPRDWDDQVCILHEGRAYRLAAARSEPRGGRTVWTYELVPAPPDWIVRRTVQYRPDDAARRRAAEADRDRRERLGVLRPFLGFLPGSMQERWQREAGVDARAATRASARIELALAAPNLVASLLVAATVPGRRALELGIGCLAAACVAEGAWRLRRLRLRGEPSGTFLLAWIAWLGRRGGERRRAARRLRDGAARAYPRTRCTR